MDSVESIGHTAEAVWAFLRARGPASLTAVEHGVDAPRALVAMAMGWLAREGKLRVEAAGRTVRYALTD